MRVVVMGGSVAGLATALLLGRDGHAVTVLERDPFVLGAAEDAPGWERRGIPHFDQPHAVIPRGRAELRANLPDAYEAMLAAGARDVDLRPKWPGGGHARGDEDFQYIAVRRPLIEWALRRAVQGEAAVTVRAGVEVTGLVLDGGRVCGVEAGGTTAEADLVVDALGRRSPTPGWLGEEPPDSSDCGVVYYSRYYRWAPGFAPPDGPWLLSPRGDLGYVAFATFPGDNRTFAALFSVPSGVAEWRALGKVAAFEAAAREVPMLRLWVDPEGAQPLTGVLPMAGLRNVLRRPGAAGAVGMVPVGDAYAHTDPVLAHGLAFALVHAAALRDALRDHRDVGDACSAYRDATFPAVEERYRFATELDDQRHRSWLGESVDLAHRDGAYALFSLAAGSAAALVDSEVFPVVVRRLGLLDSTRVLDEDEAMQRRIEEVFARLLAGPRRPLGPSRDEMLALLASATTAA